MSYVETLDVNQKKAIELMVKSMVKRGITNKYMHAGIMAVVSKESGFKPKFTVDDSINELMYCLCRSKGNSC